jgi:hypothetical protein
MMATDLTAAKRTAHVSFLANGVCLVKGLKIGH